MRKTKLSFDDEKFAKLFHKVDASALHGESNGLELLLDAEQFNYAYYQG